jgi:hypothetical protein
MLQVCNYRGRTPLDLPMCNHCNLFLETCTPIVGYDGFLFGECDSWLCEFCNYSCNFKDYINL